MKLFGGMGQLLRDSRVGRCGSHRSHVRRHRTTVGCASSEPRGHAGLHYTGLSCTSAPCLHLLRNMSVPKQTVLSLSVGLAIGGIGTLIYTAVYRLITYVASATD